MRDGQALDILMSIVDLPTAERAAALDEACGGDDGLRARVEALLEADAAADGFLPTAAGGGPVPRSSDMPDRIGPYRIEREIGSGGFGVVYAAEQQAPIQRRVAVKVIKPGMDSREVVRRFELERRALALMNHPHVARVFDGGVVAEGRPGAGRPYFAMEYVEGLPITTYADRADLDAAARVRLLLQACAAAQHAHTKGIVHRDLKPSNVMVAEADGSAQCKVIDFGIAKALAEADQASATAVTSAGALVGTPQYMSPEQARGSEDIDTRTDVYALGVVLYELLTGTTPFVYTPGEGVDVFRRRLQTADPPAPSSRRPRAAETDEEAASPAIRPMAREFRGDLDAIVLKALRRDPDERYPTVAALADDLRRYLSDEPVSARRPSLAYKLAKFVRRNRAVTIASATALLAIIIGAGASLRFGVDAQRNADRVQGINQFLINDLFLSAHPADLGPEARLVDVVDRAAPFADERFAGDPEMLFRIHTLLGQMYKNVYRNEDACRHFERAIEMIDHTPGLTAAQRATPLLQRGEALVREGRLDQAEADVRRAAALFGPGEAGVLSEPGVSLRLAMVLAAQRRYEEAEPLFVRSIDALMERDPRPELLLGGGLSSRLAMLAGQGRTEDMIVAANRLIDLGTSGRGDFARANLVSGRFWKANCLLNLGRFDEAADEAEVLVTAVRDRWGAASPNYASAIQLRRSALSRAGRYDEAEALHGELFEVIADVFGPHHYEVERAMAAIVAHYERKKDAAGYIAARTRHLLLRLYVAGPREAESVRAVAQIGTELLGAQPWIDAIRAELDEVPPGHNKRGRLFANAAIALIALDAEVDADRLFTEAVAATTDAERPDEVRRIILAAYPARLESEGRDAEASSWRSRLAAPAESASDR